MDLLAWPAMPLCLAFLFLVVDPRGEAGACEVFGVVAQGPGLGQPRLERPKPGQPKPGQPRPGQLKPGRPRPRGPWLLGLGWPREFGHVLERRSGGRYGVA